MNASKIALPPFFALFLLYCFAAFGALLPTPALPLISQYFQVPSSAVESLMSFYLVGYAGGQLLYGPLANSYGRKIAITVGNLLSLVACLLSVVAVWADSFSLLVFSRFLVAFGAAAPMVVVMILIKDLYEGAETKKMFAKLILSFSVIPFASVAVGGVVTHHFGWQALTGVMFFYGLLCLFLQRYLPETLRREKRIPISVKNLAHSYQRLFRNWNYVCLIFLFCLVVSSIYLFNGLAPLIVIKAMGVSPQEYGFYSALPSLGIFLGGWMGHRLVKRLSGRRMVFIGAALIFTGGCALLLQLAFHFSNLWFFYGMAILVFGGYSLALPTISTSALSQAHDHVNGAALMNAVGLTGSGLLVALAGKAVESAGVHGDWVLPIVIAVIGVGMTGLGFAAKRIS